MNIFVVDTDPQVAARSLCDKHVIKMILESSQLLCTAFHELGVDFISPAYFLKATHRNHPCAIWTRETAGNYLWLARHNLALCGEYTFRYGKIHKCQREGLVDWLASKLRYTERGVRTHNRSPDKIQDGSLLQYRSSRFLYALRC
jgi:hypothetical protein